MAAIKTDAEKEATRRCTAMVESITVRVYCKRLEQDSPGAVQRMLEKDKDDGTKIRGRAMSYLPIVRAVLDVLEAPENVVAAALRKEPF